MTRRCLLAVFLISCTSTAPDGEPPAPDLPIEPRFQPLADKIEAERAMLGASGVAVLVQEHGKVTFAHGFGVKQAGGTEPVHATTLFRIGSTTKMMTTVALLQLIAAGQASLDDPVTKSIPAFHVLPSADQPSSIKLRNLLSHTSGLADYPNEIDGPHDDASLESYMTGGFGAVGYIMAPSGRMWNYSNPNFSVAGLAVEKIGGIPYRQAMHDRVWQPLGMDRTTFLPADVLADGDYAIGVSSYKTGTPMPQPPDAYDNAWSRPAGFAFSSVYDLGKFAEFVIAGDPQVLPDAQRLAMQSAQFNTEDAGPHEQYGFGLFVQDFMYLADGWHPAHIVQHGGAVPGFSCDLYMAPDEDFVIAVLANADGAYFSDSIGFALQTYANLAPATAVPADALPDPATFASLAGNYQDDFNVGRIVITHDAGKLAISMPDLDMNHVTYAPMLQPIAHDVFRLTIDNDPLEITFLRDAAGKPEYLRERSFVAKRVMMLAPPSRPVRLLIRRDAT
ncbi:MAG TPA: serine hydrolase domain-containing protein [Kofleriaceae bacterium]